MKTPAEPLTSHFSNPVAKYFAATRPAFILATIVPILLGFAYTHYKGYEIQWPVFFLVLLAAIFLHAGVNVLNDYYDALNGTDAMNQERIYPFTGGSRFIQNNVLSIEQVRNFGIGLISMVVIIGLYLVYRTGLMLFLLGFFGVFIGWAYSAPPLRLNSRGLGELTVLAGFSLLPFGAWLTQTGTASLDVLLIALPLGLLTANLLYINQYPDRKADIQAGKMHWVARLPTHISRWGYWLIAGSALALVPLLIYRGLLPPLAWISLLPGILSIYAGIVLLQHSHQPQQLERAIKATLLAMLLHGGLLILALLL